jgi:acetyl esterase/lipase
VKDQPGGAPAVTSTISHQTVRVPYDRELQDTIDSMAVAARSNLTLETIAATRVALEASAPRPDLRGGAIVAAQHTAPGPPGEPDLAVTVYQRRERRGAAPLVYFIHGGGMIVGTRNTGINTALAWLDELDLVIATAEYRLAPEAPHPAPVEDCYAGLLWAAEHMGDWRADADRLVVVGGSAGGGLGAATTILSRDRSGPTIAAQMLMCPMLDDRNQTVSSHQYDGIGIWDRTNNLFGWSALLGEHPGGPDVSPYAAPARLEDYSGLPPTFIDAGAAEVFRDEAVNYASRLWEAGVQTELHVWAGGFHGFAGLGHNARVSTQARAAQQDWLRRTLEL